MVGSCTLAPVRTRGRSRRACPCLFMPVHARPRLFALVRGRIAPARACVAPSVPVRTRSRSGCVLVRVGTIAGCSWSSMAERHWNKNKIMRKKETEGRTSLPLPFTCIDACSSIQGCARACSCPCVSSAAGTQKLIEKRRKKKK